MDIDLTMLPTRWQTLLEMGHSTDRWLHRLRLNPAAVEGIPDEHLPEDDEYIAESRLLLAHLATLPPDAPDRLAKSVRITGLPAR